MPTIAEISPSYFQVPLDEVLTDAKHGDHTHFELITVTVRPPDGTEGTRYTYTVGRGGRAVHAMIEHDLAGFLRGREAADVEALHDTMFWHLHYVGRGGIASFAISAVNIALCDLRCKAADKPLWQVAGGQRTVARLTLVESI